MNKIGSGLIVKGVLAVAVTLGAVSVFANGLFATNKPVTEDAPRVVEAEVLDAGETNPWALVLAGGAVALWAGQRRRRND